VTSLTRRLPAEGRIKVIGLGRAITVAVVELKAFLAQKVWA